MNRSSLWPIVVPLLIIGGLAAWLGWQRWQPAPATPVTSVSVPSQEPMTAPPAPASPASAIDAVRFPIEALTNPQELPLPAPPMPSNGVDTQVSDTLFALLGKDKVLSWLALDGFPTRVVVTVDNLMQKHASSRYWPTDRTPARFVVQNQGEATVIDPANAARYSAFVGLVEQLDMKKVARAYVRLYPRFQQAYEQLGYPNKYFNDRLVDVLDHLLATPTPADPLKVRLTEVKGPFESTRPWVRYEFEAPDLEDRSAGQKILLRMGQANAQRLKLKLIELRVLLTRGAVVPSSAG
ncbi:MAG: DUF3014 domain-containing protein [Pseudomonadota bacterium]